MLELNPIERPRQMELLYTPKAGLITMMKDNALSIDELLFLAASKKLAATDIRLHCPVLCDKMLATYLRQEISGWNKIEQSNKSQNEIQVVV